MGAPECEGLVGRAVAGQAVDGRTFVTPAPTSVAQAKHRHIAYFGAAGFVPAPALLEALRGRPALTITDTAAGTSGGVVHFLLDGGRVRFEIDARLAELNGLTISSRVLELALRVKRAELQDLRRIPS